MNERIIHKMGKMIEGSAVPSKAKMGERIIRKKGKMNEGSAVGRKR